MAGKTTRTRVAFATAAACVAALGVAEAASAAEVRTNNVSLIVTDLGSEVNHMTVEVVDKKSLRVRDTATPPVPGQGCRLDGLDTDAVICEHREDLWVRTGAEADEVAIDSSFVGTVEGGAGDDLLVTSDAQWPANMRTRATELAHLADDVRDVRWMTTPWPAVPPSAQHAADAWKVGVAVQERHPDPGFAGTGARSAGNALYGGDGDDVVLGGEGKTELSGGPGTNFAAGGPGDDFFIGGYGAGNPTVFVPGTGGDAALSTEDSEAYIDYYERQVPISGNMQNAIIDDGDGALDLVNVNGYLGGRARNDVTGSTFAQLIYGGKRSDHLNGGLGTDLVVGGPIDDGPQLPLPGGSDKLDGGGSSDVIVPTTADDVVDGGDSQSASRDAVAYLGRTAGVEVDLEHQTAVSGSESDKLVDIDGAIGGAGDDVLRDTEEAPLYQNNMLDGGAGDDLLVGGRSNSAGPDQFFGGDGNDVIDATRGLVTPWGDEISCGNGDDRVDARPQDAVDADCEAVKRD